jgi:hypothetical protein
MEDPKTYQELQALRSRTTAWNYDDLTPMERSALASHEDRLGITVAQDDPMIGAVVGMELWLRDLLSSEVRYAALTAVRKCKFALLSHEIAYVASHLPELHERVPTAHLLFGSLVFAEREIEAAKSYIEQLKAMACGHQ